MYSPEFFMETTKTMEYTLSIDIKLAINALCKSVDTEPSFKIMVQEKISMQDLTRELNKLTQDNKSVQIPIILKIVAINNIEDFMTTFFNVICINSFFSDVYVLLYKELNLISDLNTYLDKQYTMMIESLNTFIIESPDNYDAYCIYKTENNRRRAFTKFIVNLVNASVISVQYYTDLVQYIISKIQLLTTIDDKERMNEYVELLAILNPKDDVNQTQIRQWSILNPTTSLGINNKILFRFMDIMCE